MSSRHIKHLDLAIFSNAERGRERIGCGMGSLLTAQMSCQEGGSCKVIHKITTVNF